MNSKKQSVQNQKLKQGHGTCTASVTSGLVNLTALFPEIKQLLQDSAYCTPEIFDAMMTASGSSGEDEGAYVWDVVYGFWTELLELVTFKKAVTATGSKIVCHPATAVAIPRGLAVHILYQIVMPYPSGQKYQLMAESVLDPITMKWVWIIKMM